jgi:hypothetical protein
MLIDDQTRTIYRAYDHILGMRLPIQDIPIVNNHPINFERRIWPKSHPRAASFLAKFHGRRSFVRFSY